MTTYIEKYISEHWSEFVDYIAEKRDYNDQEYDKADQLAKDEFILLQKRLRMITPKLILLEGSKQSCL